MNRLLILSAALVLVTGCAHYSTTQTDYSYAPNEKAPTRKIRTHVSATTFLDANSSLSKFRASQTDKTQGTSVGSLEQSSSSSNLVTISGNAESITKMLMVK